MVPRVLIAAALYSTSLVPRARLAQDAGEHRSRSSTVIDGIHRSGAVPRCWNAYLHMEPEAGSVRFRVRVEVSAAGVVERVNVLDPTPPPLVECVRTQVQRVTFTAGSAVTVETTYAFQPGASSSVRTPQ